jgi:hypothetical protein
VESGTWTGATLDPALAGRRPDKSLAPKPRRSRPSEPKA